MYYNIGIYYVSRPARISIINKMWIISVGRESRGEVIYKHAGLPNCRSNRQNARSFIALVSRPKFECHIDL